jgi:ornithine cyclodeaminase/alanine dehydrogenase-like protein (mu-crystallin family)
MLESASLPYVSPAEVARLLPYAEAVDELRAAFSEPRRDSPERVRVEIPRGELLLMPAFGPEGVGVKLVTLHGRDSESPHPRVQGIYVLFSADGLAPELILDGAALTERRTAAVSALATQCLARENASRLVVFGTGRQARAHVDAVCSVRDIEYVGIVGHRPGPARVLVDELGERGLPAEVVSAEAVAEADIVCTCTPSTQPLFEDRWLARGVHVNAIGAYREDMCELPAATLAQALLTVEDRGAALVEAGDIIQAIAERAIGPGHIAGDLTDLARGAVGRSSAEQVTVFKSVGIADEDLVLVRMIARRLGVGRREATMYKRRLP